MIRRIMRDNGADVELVFRTESFSSPDQSVTKYSMIFLSTR